MGYRTFERDTFDLGFTYCVWINFRWEQIQRDSSLITGSSLEAGKHNTPPITESVRGEIDLAALSYLALMFEDNLNPRGFST